jgi:methyl-accepting chemotaxis protein
MAKRSTMNRYLFMGALFGIGAPIAWMFLRLLFFYRSGEGILAQTLHEITKSPENLALYSYMGIGTSLVMGTLGALIGRSTDQLHDRAAELDALHNEVATQKEVFENRYKVLDNNVKHFHQISSQMQKSTDLNEVLSLCVKSLHTILGYERVNILLADENREYLDLVVSTDVTAVQQSVRLPLDERIGIIYKSFAEKRVFLVENMESYPAEFRLHPPFDILKPFRSKCFILCPIVVQGQAIGMFGLDNKFSHRTLNDTDTDTIMLFADQIASAVTRINLLNSINTLTQKLATTFTELLENRELHSRTVRNLKLAMASLSEGTSQIAGNAEKNMAAVDATSTSANQISEAIEQVSSNLDALSETVYKSASAMEEINATLMNVKQNASISHSVASQVKVQADTSLALVNETISALDEIQRAVDLSYEGISRLSENSSKIESILNVINEITKRTNLLALNASIIAAQAGEYGRSFGVVADEIRNLSLQTGHSTGEITGIIEDIMSESRMAANNVRITKDLVQQGVILGQNTGTTLTGIANSANEAMEMTEEIKLATEEQSHSLSLLTSSIEDVSTMVTHIFSASKEQAQATKQIAGSVQTIKQMTLSMVEATGRQVRDTNEIRISADQTADLITNIFADIESRQSDSATVVKALAEMNRST